MANLPFTMFTTQTKQQDDNYNKTKSKHHWNNDNRICWPYKREYDIKANCLLQYLISTAFAKLGIITIHHIDITFLAYSIFAPNADFY